MRRVTVLTGGLAALAIAGLSGGVAVAQALAETRVSDVWAGDDSGNITLQLNRQSAFNVAADRAFGPALEFEAPRETDDGLAATTRRDIWFGAGEVNDRLRLDTRGVVRRADGSPLPASRLDGAAYDVDGYDLTYTRGWNLARGYTASGLEVTLTPHAGIGVGDRGGSAEAGATLKVGSSASRMVPDGGEAFGERARWYIYAAGSGRAVGYNFARTRDGDFARSGYSHDSGAFLGDASLGVAFRKGDVQSSFGLVYREIEAEGLRSGRGLDNDVTEGLVAFQLSIKPEW